MNQLIATVSPWAALGLLLPLLVGVVTKRETASGLQGLLFTAAASLLGVVDALVKAEQAHTVFDWKTAAGSAVAAFVLGQSAHSALWKPAGVTRWLQDFGSKVDVEGAKLAGPKEWALLKQDVARFLEDAGARLDANAVTVNDAAHVVSQAAQVVATQAASAPAPYVPAAPLAPLGEVDPAPAADLVVPDPTDDDKIVAP